VVLVVNQSVRHHQANSVVGEIRLIILWRNRENRLSKIPSNERNCVSAKTHVVTSDFNVVVVLECLLDRIVQGKRKTIGYPPRGASGSELVAAALVEKLE
jgi:hypothetical protein